MNSRSEVLARTLPTQPHTAFILLPGQWQNGTTKMSSKTVPWYFPSTRLLPGLEAIVIPLADVLSFSEPEKHRKKRLPLPSCRNGPEGNGQLPNPLNLQRHPVMVRLAHSSRLP